LPLLVAAGRYIEKNILFKVPNVQPLRDSFSPNPAQARGCLE
jgi:hypothetical protein